MYGSITFLVSLVFNAIVNRLIQKDQPSWVFWKWILITLLLILCIAFVNYIFSFIVFNDFKFSLKILLGVMANTLLLGAFPLVFIGSISLVKSRQKNVGIAKEFVLPETKNRNTTIQLGAVTYAVDDILFIEAMQNYALIYSKNSNKQTIRNTLTKLENELSPHNIIRCHRSYLVNINAIESVSGNAQGLKLQLKNVGQIVPVSRKYISKVKAVLA